MLFTNSALAPNKVMNKIL